MAAIENRTCSVASHKLMSSSAEGKGRAVICRAPISAGELVALWGGIVVDLPFARTLPRRDRAQCLQVDKDHVLWTAQSDQSVADWVNHSCDPNCGLQGQIGLVAMKDIRPGEEVCFDYAMCSTSDLDEFDCACGSKNCRLRVRADDWKNPLLQLRYRGFFSPFIEKLIRDAPLRQNDGDMALIAPGSN